jgi:hypothetical protein
VVGCPLGGVELGLVRRCRGGQIEHREQALRLDRPSKLPVGWPVAFFSVLARVRLMAFLAVMLVVKTYRPNSDSRGTRARSRILLRTDRRRQVMGVASEGSETNCDGDVTEELRYPHGGTEANRICLFRRGKRDPL